ELLPLANGNRLMLASPLRGGINLRPLRLGADQTIVDCVIEEANPAGRLVWRWRASDHIRPTGSLHPYPVTGEPEKAYDVYHCNSIDEDPSTGDLLLSPHNTDAVYRIRRPGGTILWKLGGNSVVGDREPHLTVTGDPERTFHAQHDARFQPDNAVS